MAVLNKIKTRLNTANSDTGAMWLFWYEHRIMSLMLIAAMVIVFLMSIPTAFAHAAGPWPWDWDPLDFLNGIFDSMIQGAIQPANDMMKNLIGTDNILQDFENLFGPGSGGYTLVKQVATVIIMPVAYVTLAIVFLVQTAKLASKFDANGTMPAFKEVIFLLLYFVIFKVLIDNSFDMCVAVFNAINTIIQGISEISFATAEPPADYFETGTVVGGLLTGLLFIVVCWLAAFAACVVGYFVIFGRSLQIYIYSAFAPIPLALMGLDETRSFGIGFIKNYIAVCLAGAIMFLVILMFPVIVHYAVGSIGGVFSVLGACILYIMALIKSGSWAKDILGG